MRPTGRRGRTRHPDVNVSARRERESDAEQFECDQHEARAQGLQEHCHREHYECRPETRSRADPRRTRAGVGHIASFSLQLRNKRPLLRRRLLLLLLRRHEASVDVRGRVRADGDCDACVHVRASVAAKAVRLVRDPHAAGQSVQEYSETRLEAQHDDEQEAESATRSRRPNSR